MQIASRTGIWSGERKVEIPKIIMSGQSSYSSTSHDGRNWSKIYKLSDLTTTRGIEYFKGKFYAADTNGKISESYDTKNWSPGKSALTGSFYVRFLKKLGGRLIAGGGSSSSSTSGLISTSTDGENWSTPITISRHPYGIAFSENRILFSTSGGYVDIYDYDLNHIQLKSISGQTGTLYSIAYGGGVLATVGAGGKVSYSEDEGDTWSTATQINGQTSTWYGVAYGNGKFVAVGNGGKHSTSIDGKNWSTAAVTGGSGILLYCIGYCNGLFITSGGRGVYSVSEDGEDWFESQYLPDSSNSVSIYCIACADE